MDRWTVIGGAPRRMRADSRRISPPPGAGRFFPLRSSQKLTDLRAVVMMSRE